MAFYSHLFVSFSVNAVNGVPSCANGLFNNEILRGEWGFDGFIVSVWVTTPQYKKEDLGNIYGLAII